MQSPFDNIVQHLFHQPSLLSVTVDELDRMAQQHPYFAAAHFLLLKKMQVTDHPRFSTQLHKTSLYFNNPLWLQFLLQPETVSNFTVSEKAPFITEETTTVTTAVQENEVHYNQAPVAKTVYHTNEQVPVNEITAHYQYNEPTGEYVEPHTEMPLEAHASIMEVITEVFHEPGQDVQQAAETPANTGVWRSAPPHDVWEKPADDTTATDEPVAEVNTDVETTNELPAGQPAFVAPEQETFTEENNTVSFNADESATVIESLQENKPAVYEPVVEEIPVAETSLAVVETPQPVMEAQQVNAVVEETPAENHDNTAAPDVMEPMPVNEKPLFKTIIETAGAKDDLLFEPYHTVDYFASQGIKLSKAEIDAKDKLGRQLKSFTEWLKSMKKLPQVSIDKILSENEESKVVADAIHSIENKEVITEAMAEVFEKQGMTEKAVEVYRKLSLLNPAKSAYFAAKTDLLKN